MHIPHSAFRIPNFPLCLLPFSFLLLLLLSLPIIAEAASPKESEEIPWSSIGTGGAHLLVESGPLEIHIQKRDRNTSRNSRAELQAMLLSPDRELLETISIPASPVEDIGTKGPVQTAVLRTVVTHPGIYLLYILVPGDRHGDKIEWSLDTNAAAWVIETARGHRDDRHSEPIIMENPERPVDIHFLPRNGKFTIEAENLAPDSGPLQLYDATGKLVSEIPVVAQQRTDIREYLRYPRPSQPEASALFTVPAAKNRGNGPWRLHFPSARFLLEIDGFTRWDKGDLYPDRTLWSPVASSWFPFLENRWLITPPQRTVHLQPNQKGSQSFTLYNSSSETRTLDLTLEFPDSRWDVRLPTETVSLKPQKKEEIRLQFTAPFQKQEQVAYLRATPRDQSGVTTYAALRVRGTVESSQKPLPLPLTLRPYAHENRQFGYSPDYAVDNQTYFDLKNNGFVLNGRWLHRQTKDTWKTTDLRQAVVKTEPETTLQSWKGIGTKIAFDSANQVYLLASSGKTVALLRSNDHGKSFTAHIIKGRENESRSWDIEQFSGHNTSDQPPAVVRITRTDHENAKLAPARRAANMRWRSTNDIELILAEKSRNGSFHFLPPVKLTSRALGSSMHSGIPSMIVSRDSKTHVVWGEATDPDASPEEVPGVPAYVATYDRETKTAGEPVFMSFGSPANDAHNTPSITMDSRGYLHVVVGTHGRPFQYLRSLKPNDAHSGWTDAIRTSENDLRQTYVGLVCDDQDNLHLVFRLWRNGEKHLDGALWAALAHQRKPANGDWEAPQVLVAPPLSDYSVYYHRLTVDRHGSPHLNYDYWSTSWLYRNDTGGPISAGSGRPGSGWGRAVITTPDHGKTWKLW